MPPAAVRVPFEKVLTDQILAIGPVRDARSTFCIRTVIDRGPLPLTSWPRVHDRTPRLHPLEEHRDSPARR
jgi:hypothetical protein